MMRIRSLSLLVLLLAVCFFSGGTRIAASAPDSLLSFGIGPEGAEGQPFSNVVFQFRINRTGDLSGPCSITVATRDGTAFTPEDYAAVNGTFTFAAGQSSLNVPVSIIGEYWAETDETFFLDIVSTTAGCSVSGATASVATILGDDSSPLACGNLIEGDTGTDAALRVDDLVRIRRTVLGLDDSLLYGCQFRRADVNGDCGDGVLDVADVTVVRQWILQGGVQRAVCGPFGRTLQF